MRNPKTHPARFQVMLLEPITGKILFDESNRMQMVQEPVCCFTVDAQKYLGFVANAQMTSADTLKLLALQREQLIQSVDDKKLLEHVINYVDYGIDRDYLLTTHDNARHKREIFEQLCQINVEVFKASKVVTLKELHKRVILDLDENQNQTVVSAIFVDHNGNELALPAFEVPHPAHSQRPWQQPLPVNHLTPI